MVNINDALQDKDVNKYNTIIKDFNDKSEEDFESVKARVADLYNRAYSILVKATNMNTKITSQVKLYTNIKGQWDTIKAQLTQWTT